MNKGNIRLEGQYVYVEEVQPKYFPYIIEWRNNPENNRFLNQPFKLTMELQTKWYEEKYLKDDTQGLFVMVDKATGTPFGTLGWTDYDCKDESCVVGRLLVGNVKYRGSKEWIEATILFSDFVYYALNVKLTYAHVVKDNIASIKWHYKWGYLSNEHNIKFPKELLVNGMAQNEYIRTKNDYEKTRVNMKKLTNKEGKIK